MDIIWNEITAVQKYIDHIEGVVSRNSYKGTDERIFAMRNLYRETVKEAKKLQNHTDDIQTISFSVRNLFELSLIIKFLDHSDGALKQWMGQLQNDALEIHAGAISLLSKHGFEVDHLESSQARVIASGEQYGVIPSKPFNMKNIAKELGFSEPYDALYKLCSKMIHPSSIWVNLPGVFEVSDDYKRVLIHVGVHHLALIAEHSKKECSESGEADTSTTPPLW